jgi:hypothetical protein
MRAVGHHKRSFPVTLSGCQFGECLEVLYDQPRTISPAKFDAATMSPFREFAAHCGLGVVAGEEPISIEIGVIELVLRGKLARGKVDGDAQ